MLNEADLADLEHDHIFLGSSHDEHARRTKWVVALTATFMVGEIIAGYLTGSMALTADGFHMATHAGALSVAAAAYAYAKRHARSARFSFGTGKVGDLAGFASALVLGMIALGIGIESAMRLFRPITVAFGTATWIACLGLFVNVTSALLLSGGHDHEHGHHHGKAHDNNLRSAYIHVVADALTSVLAITALLSGRFLGWVWMDPIMGIIGAMVIGSWSWTLMRDTAAVLLDTADNYVADEIRELVEAPGDAKVTDLHVWRVGPEAHAAIVEVASQVSVGTLRDRLKSVHEIGHLTLAVR
jgi:cation diffusion facilitator family transporter